MAKSSAIKAGEAFVSIFADTGPLVQGLNRASAAIKKFTEDSAKRIAAWGNTFKNAGKITATASAAILGSMIAGATSFASTGDAIEKMSKRTGIAAENLSEWGFVADQCGASLDSFEKGIKGLQKTLDGSAASAKKLEKIGLTLADFNGKTVDEQMGLMLDKLAAIPDANKRAALSMKMFGGAGRELLPMMAEGRDGIAKLREEARSLGLTMGTKDAAAAAALTDAWTKVKKTAMAVYEAIGAALAPTLTDLCELVAKNIGFVVRWIKEHRTMIVSVAKVVAAVVAFGGSLFAIGGILTAIGGAITAFGTVATGAISAAIMTVTTLGAVLGLLMSPVGLVAAAAVGLGTYFAYSSGMIGESIGWLKDCFANLYSFAAETFKGIADALAAGDIAAAGAVAWAALKVVWQTGVHWLYEKWYWLNDMVVSSWQETVGFLAACFIKGWGGLQALWVETVYTIQTLWTGFIDTFMNVWKKAEELVARGLGWIVAKISGLDAAEMDVNIREKYAADKKARESGKAAKLNDIEKYRNNSLDQINSEQRGTLDSLGSGRQRKRDERRTAYEREKAANDNALADATQAWRHSIKSAADKRAALKSEPLEKAKEWRANYNLPKVVQENVKGLSSAGTFSAFDVGALNDSVGKEQLDVLKMIAKNTANKEGVRFDD